MVKICVFKMRLLNKYFVSLELSTKWSIDVLTYIVSLINSNLYIDPDCVNNINHILTYIVSLINSNLYIDPDCVINIKSHIDLYCVTN